MHSRTALWLAFAALLATPAVAQDRNRNRPGAPERTVYVPIEEFDEIFDRERGGVFVPYQELLRLLDKASGQTATPLPPPEVQPPADYVLVGTSLKGVAGDSVVQFEATFDIEVLRDDRWVIVPIGLGEAALEDVQTSAGQRAVVGPMAMLAQKLAQQQQGRPQQQQQPPLTTQGYGVILKGAGRLQTTARFAVPISSRPGQSSFDITLPAAALCNFEVALPQSGLRVSVANALATEATSLDEQDKTQVRAYFGAAQTAKVTWNPRPKQVEGAEEREPLLFAETESSMRLDEGVLQVRTKIDYRILQAPCGQFVLRFPKGFTLLSVTGQNMSADPVPEETAEGQTITVRLHEKAADNYSLVVSLEKILAEGGQEALEYPRVETIGTERESGVLAAQASRFLTLEPETLRGLSQLDAAKLSADQQKVLEWNPRSGTRPPLAFRYLRQPYALQLKSTQIQPEVDGKVFSLATVRDDEIELRSLVTYTITKRGIFGVRVKLPEGYDVRECGPDNQVKDWRVTAGVLQVDFVNQIEGGFNLFLTGLIRRNTGPEAAGLALPLLELLDVKKETGVLGVAAQRHLKLTTDKDATKILLPVAIRDLPGLGFPHHVANGDEQLALGFKYGKRDGVETAFDIKKREPQVTARVEALVNAQEDLISVDSTVRFTVEYAGVEQVRIRVPKALGSETEFKIKAEGIIKDPRVAVDPESDEHSIWTIPLQGKKTGEFAVDLHYDIKMNDFSPGEREVRTLHEIEVLDCFTETGDFALVKHENLVITDEREMLERRDKQELPETLRRHGPIQAYRYVSHPHSLTLHLVKYDFQAPLGIVIRHLHQDEVVGADGKLQIEAWLEVQNNAEQFLTVLLPLGAEFKGLKVAGQTKAPSRGPKIEERETILIPLGEVSQSNADSAFQVRVRFNMEGEGDLTGLGSVTLRTLEFPLGKDETSGELNKVPVARLTRYLYLPEDVAYLEFDTDATKHFDETSLWEELKLLLKVRTGRERRNTYQGAKAANDAITQLRALAPGAQDLGDYPPLELPRGQKAYTFEKLDNPSRLSVTYSSWPLFYLFDVLVLLGVVGLGVFLDLRRMAGPVVYVTLGAALCVLGANFGGRSLEPFFASGLVGSLGLGVFFLGRGVWRELTVNRHQRRLAELAEEAQVAKARAQAADAESRLRGQGGAVAVAAPATKAATLTAEERKTAADMPLDDGAGGASETPSGSQD